MSEPLVSVIVLSYNHERFIQACLEGILRQDYPHLEVIVSDDASPDGTVDRIKAIAKNDERIRLFESAKNRGPSVNFEFALAQCRGSLVAFCEGDDVWTSSEKLSLQMAEMARDESVSLVYANYAKIDESGSTTSERVLTAQPAKFGLHDMISNHGPATNSVLVRREVFPGKFQNAFHEVPNPDVFIIGYGLRHGESRYINQVLSAHREHGDGIWTSKERFERGLIRYSTLIKFYRDIRNRTLTRASCYLFERQVILAREKGSSAFNLYFSELPLKRRLVLKLKWAYSKYRR